MPLQLNEPIHLAIETLRGTTFQKALLLCCSFFSCLLCFPCFMYGVLSHQQTVMRNKIKETAEDILRSLEQLKTTSQTDTTQDPIIAQITAVVLIINTKCAQITNQLINTSVAIVATVATETTPLVSDQEMDDLQETVGAKYRQTLLTQILNAYIAHGADAAQLTPLEEAIKQSAAIAAQPRMELYPSGMILR